MIYGIGTDILRVARMAKLLERHGERGAKRILTPQEQGELTTLSKTQQACFLAKRFAAKEAFSKAMGTGIRGEISFQNIEVRHDPLGKPSLFFLGALIGTVEKLGIQAHLSLSDEREYVLAYVVLERA